MATDLFISEVFDFLRLNVQTFLVFCLAFLLAWLFARRPRNLPPYPAGWRPVLGHLLALGRAPHVKLTEWRQQYGDVFTVRMGMEDVVVLNGYTAVKDALVDRSELFASRPPNYIFDFVTGCGKGIGSGRWGNVFKQKKRFALSSLKTLGVKVGKGGIEDKIQDEASCLCVKVADYDGKPFDVEGDLHVAIANVICSVIFGNRFDYGDERFKELSKAVVSILAQFGAGQLIGVFPFLRFIPGANRTLAGFREHAGKIQKFIREEIDHHRRDLDRENPRDFLDLALMEVEKPQTVDNLGEDNVMFIVQDLFLAGIDTITTTLRWGLLYMALNRDIQEKVQTEIDAVVGAKQPSLSHRSLLPYTEATVMEAQRIRTVIRIGIPHATTQAIKVGQFDLPAGTQVLMNLYSLHMDPIYWPDPDRFDPRRFLDAEGCVVNNPDSFMPFSGGRRVCLGKQLAKMELFLIFTTLMQNFTFTLPEGTDTFRTDGVTGGNLTPHPHELCAIPR